MSVEPMTGQHKKSSLFQRIWTQRAFFLMLLPGIVYYIVYRYIPVVTEIVVSLKKYNVNRGVWANKWADPLLTNFIKSVISFVMVVTVNTISKRWGESMW